MQKIFFSSITLAILGLLPSIAFAKYRHSSPTYEAGIKEGFQAGVLSVPEAPGSEMIALAAIAILILGIAIGYAIRKYTHK